MNSLLDRRLVTLMAVAETGSMTAAANRLYVTQPAVSQQLASLGKDLGLPLLTHRGTRVELTPVARELVAYARRLTLDNRAVLAHLQTGQTPPLRLGVTVSLGNFLLPRLLADPTIAARALEVTIANTATLAAQLRAGKLTAALVEGNFPAADFASLDLGLADFIGVAAQPLPALTLPELFSHYLLVREPGSGTREILTNWLAAHNAGLADFSRTLALNSPAAIINLLKEGVGISFMYRALVEEELTTGDLHPLPLAGFPLRHPLSLIYLRGSSFADELVPLAEVARRVLKELTTK